MFPRFLLLAGRVILPIVEQGLSELIRSVLKNMSRREKEKIRGLEEENERLLAIIRESGLPDAKTVSSEDGQCSHKDG